jgi:hypothetical protein
MGDYNGHPAEPVIAAYGGGGQMPLLTAYDLNKAYPSPIWIPFYALITHVSFESLHNGLLHKIYDPHL